MNQIKINYTDDIYKVNDLYSKLTEEHAPTESKTIRRNQASFMNKELIMNN